MPNIGPGELILILVIALIIIGPGKLPDVGAALGKSIREFRKASTDITEATRDRHDARCRPPAAPAATAAPAPTPEPSVPTPTSSTVPGADRGAARSRGRRRTDEPAGLARLRSST